MKKLVILILILTSINLIYAQEEASSYDYFVGGSFNISSQKNSYPGFSNLLYGNIWNGTTVDPTSGGIVVNTGTTFTRSSSNISTSLGKTFSSNWQGGLDLSYGHSNVKISSNNDYKDATNNFGIGVFTRYIIAPQNKFNVYIRPSISGHFSFNKESQSDNVVLEGNSKYMSANVGLGLMYSINNRWRATANLGGLNYIVGKTGGDATDVNFSSFNANFRLSTIYFGVEFLF